MADDKPLKSQETKEAGRDGAAVSTLPERSTHSLNTLGDVQAASRVGAVPDAFPNEDKLLTGDEKALVARSPQRQAELDHFTKTFDAHFENVNGKEQLAQVKLDGTTLSRGKDGDWYAVNERGQNASPKRAEVAESNGNLAISYLDGGMKQTIDVTDDGANRIVTAEFPNGALTQSVDGRPVFTRDPADRQIQYSYDEAGRGPELTSRQPTGFTITGGNQQTERWTYAAGSGDYQKEAFDTASKQFKPTTERAQFEIQDNVLVRDPAGKRLYYNLDGTTLPERREHEFTNVEYDRTGKPNHIALSDGSNTHVSYQADGSVEKLTLDDGRSIESSRSGYEFVDGAKRTAIRADQFSVDKSGEVQYVTPEGISHKVRPNGLHIMSSSTKEGGTSVVVMQHDVDKTPVLDRMKSTDPALDQKVEAERQRVLMRPIEDASGRLMSFQLGDQAHVRAPNGEWMMEMNGEFQPMRLNQGVDYRFVDGNMVESAIGKEFSYSLDAQGKLPTAGGGTTADTAFDPAASTVADPAAETVADPAAATVADDGSEPAKRQVPVLDPTIELNGQILASEKNGRIASARMPDGSYWYSSGPGNEGVLIRPSTDLRSALTREPVSLEGGADRNVVLSRADGSTEIYTPTGETVLLAPNGAIEDRTLNTDVIRNNPEFAKRTVDLFDGHSMEVAADGKLTPGQVDIVNQRVEKVLHTAGISETRKTEIQKAHRELLAETERMRVAPDVPSKSRAARVGGAAGGTMVALTTLMFLLRHGDE